MSSIDTLVLQVKEPEIGRELTSNFWAESQNFSRRGPEFEKTYFDLYGVSSLSRRLVRSLYPDNDECYCYLICCQAIILKS